MSFAASLYLVAEHRLAAGDLHSLIPELASAGVGAIQLREKEMEARDLLRVAEPVRDACRAAGVPFILNDRPDVALILGADGVHVGQNDLSPHHVRRILPEGLVGWSTHAPEEVDAAAREPIDYFAVGPVFATPTKPGRPAAGLELLRYAAASATSLPWFAIGGIDGDNVDAVLSTGARRIVVVRAITLAPDPPAAAASLRARLDAVEGG